MQIDTAMRLSRRRGVAEIIVETLLRRQDDGEKPSGLSTVTGDVSNVKDTLSSWDNCMQENYCKWPVICGIVVVSLIILSVATCIIRCCCCGVSCCCSCFRCLACCQCCRRCCESDRRKPSKFAHGGDIDTPYASPMPLMGGGSQFATFEVGKNGFAVDKPVSADALPPMPSWEGASKKHVLDEKNDVEMGNLDPATGQQMPLMNGSAGPPSPALSNPSNAGGYMGVPNRTHSPNPNGGYRGIPATGAPPSAAPLNRTYSPAPSQGSSANYNDGFAPAPLGGGRPGMGNNGPNPRYPPQPHRQFSGPGSARPAYSDRDYSDNSFATANTSQTYPYAARGPSRGPNASPAPPRMQTPSNNNMGGFDFGTGVTSPTTYTQQGYDAPAPAPTHVPYRGYNASPAPAAAEAPAYPGYRPYQPQRTDTADSSRALMPGQEPPQNWDPTSQR